MDCPAPLVLSPGPLYLESSATYCKITFSLTHIIQWYYSLGYVHSGLEGLVEIDEGLVIIRGDEGMVG
jgi:hypothetical protein